MPLIDADFERPFPDSEYERRFKSAQELMASNDLDVLLLTDPTNQHYLSGYESESYYTFQMLILIAGEDEPLFVARNMEERAAGITTWLSDDRIRCYTDEYAPNSLYHPVDWVQDLLGEFEATDGRIGVEKSSQYLSIDTLDRLQSQLTDAEIVDVSMLINRLYLHKSDAELEYMRKAAEITDRGMETAAEVIAEGVRENDAVAEVLRTLVRGTDEFGGTMPSVTPATGPYHFTFSDRTFKDGDVFGLEFSGCVRNYYSPLCRTFSIGEPSSEVRELWQALDEDLQLILDTVEPGRTCEEVEQIYRAEANYPKAARSGYVIGLGVTSWAEGTTSFTEGDDTVLRPGMTFHSNPSIDTLNYPGGIGPNGLRMLHSETYVVTEDGCEVFGSYPRQLIVID